MSYYKQQARLKSNLVGLVGVLFLASFVWLSATGCDLHFDLDSVPEPGQSDVGDMDIGNDVAPDTDDGETSDVAEPEDVEQEEDTDGCEAESDQELCDEAGLECGTAMLEDRCGVEQIRDCGGCDDGEECQDNSCSCQAQSNDEFCDDHHDDACGTLTGEDNCGAERTVVCGSCDEGSCNADNFCEECGVDCDGLCGLVPDGCGGFVDCSAEADGVICDDGTEACIDFECQEDSCDARTECESDECGEQPDGCGDTFTCSSDCDEGYDCEQNMCVCQPETDQELCDIAASSDDVECGSVTSDDRCGNQRSLNCGECSDGLACEENQCVFDSGICDGLDFDTNFEHCGECTQSCTTAQVCQAGSCETFECLEDQGENQGSCDPVNETGCDFDSEHCTMTLVFSGGTPSHFETTCDDKDDAGSLSEGESCSSGSDCAEGLFCIGWDSPDPRGQLCSRMCDRNTQEGCADDEFCAHPFIDDDSGGPGIEGIGFCSERCSPADPSACDSGQRCTAHPGFPEGMCTPNFQCLNNGGSGGKSEGSECDRAELTQDGCPSGLTCAPVGEEGQDLCVEPCQSDSDCADAACINAPDPWSPIRYCELE